MKLPSTRILATIVMEALLLIVVANLTSFYFYQDAQNRLSNAHEVRYRSYVLAGELRTSSNDLTNLARLFVVTGKASFRSEYEEVLAIRAGKTARPQDYNRIYWDFVIAGRQKPHLDGPAIAFGDLIRSVGRISGAEFAMLKQAEERSNALAKIETVAMNAAVGLFEDANGAFTRHGDPDRVRALDMMFSDDYLRLKAEIMDPIDQFFVLMDKRTSLTVLEIGGDVSLYGTLTIVFMAMLVVLSLISGWSALRLRHLNEEKWTTSLLQAGWTAVPNIIIKKQATLGLDPIDLNIVIHLLHSWTTADELPSPTVDMIAKEIGVSVRTVQKHIGDLQDSGLITRVERRYTRFGSAANLYSLDGLIRATMPFTDPEAPVAASLSEPAGAVASRLWWWQRLLARIEVGRRG